MPPADHRHLRTGSLNIPHPNGMMPMHGSNRFDGPRSPPNTSHVPCKFFRQGACQAGNACPFSHDIGAATENICKYFAKGNCKFGPKCANIHVLPDGRRINYGKNGVSFGNTPINLGTRVNPNTYHQAQTTNSALTNSIMHAEIDPYSVGGGSGGGYLIPNDKRSRHQPSMENDLPVIDTTYSSNPASAYGSPRDEDLGRTGLGAELGLSSANAGKVRALLDTPLPASFDSNGISHAARYGPLGSSMPPQLGGVESPPSAPKDVRASAVLKMLHSSAFGMADRLSPLGPGLGLGPGSDSNGFGSSPPAGSSSHLSGDFFGRRIMHSTASALRYRQAKLMSSSVPKPADREWEPDFPFEEDLVPAELAGDLLTPMERARRSSGTSGTRPDLGGELSFKHGSPLSAASPSRWGPLFQQQKEEEERVALEAQTSSSRAMKQAAASAFGHVGSPLRNSSLASAMELHGRVSNGRSSAAAAGSESVSILTAQFQRARIGGDSSTSSSPRLQPIGSTSQRIPSSNGSVGVIGKERERERHLERHVSSGSIGSSVTGRFTTPIDEEDPAFVFTMEEEDDLQTRARKRLSAGPQRGTASPLSSTWSYASVAGSAAESSNGRGTISKKGRDMAEAVGGR